MQCSKCGRVSPETAKFCGYCGLPLRPPPEAPPPETPPPPTPPAPARPARLPRSPGLRLGLGIATALIGALGIYLLAHHGGLQSLSRWWDPHRSQIQQFETALRQGNLVHPTGQSAYDLYVRLKNDPRFQPERLQALRTRVLPVLEQTAEEVFRRWHDESRLERFSDWSDVCRLLEWLFDLKGDDSTQARWDYCRGQVAFTAEDYDTALRWFQQALDRHPNWALALNGIGRCYVRKRDWAQAERYYRAAASAEPTWAYPYINLGGLYTQTRQYQQAEQAYRRALELAPTKPFAHYALGQLYLQLRRRAEACKAFQNAYQYGRGQSPRDLGFDPEDLPRLMKRLGC